MISRRPMAVIGAMTVSLLALAGCATSSSSAQATHGKVQVSLLVNVTPNLTKDWWTNLVKPFEAANPDIEVVIQDPGKEGVAAAVPRLLAAGDPPDVVESLPPTTTLSAQLVDLSTYKWASEGPLADQYKIDGKNLMAGIGMQLQSLWFYNKTAFKQAGIEKTPTTVEELTADLGKLKAAGWTPIQSGGDWMSSYALQTLALPTVVAQNDNWYQRMSKGELTFSGTYGQAVKQYADWIAAGYVNKDALGIKYADAEQAFLAGKSALYPMGSWFVASQAKSTGGADIGVFAAPAFSGTSKPAMGANIASPYVIMKASPHQDAAAKLVEFLVTDHDSVLNELKADGNYRGGYSYDMNDLGKQLLQIVTDTPAAQYTPTGAGYGQRTLPNGYSTELNTQTQALLGGTSASDVLKAMDDWFKANAK